MDNKKQWSACLLALLFMAILSGCGGIKEPDEGLLDSKAQTENLDELFEQEDRQREAHPAKADAQQQAGAKGPADWSEVKGLFYGENYTESAFPALQIVGVGENKFLFALYPTAADEKEGAPALTGLAVLQDNGSFLYEGEGAVRALRFALGENQLSVSMDGELSFSPEGVYRQESSETDPKEELLVQMIALLPGEEGNSAVKLQDTGLVDGWFYLLSASSGRNFYVAKDFSSIYRVPENGFPELLWGGAQTMMEDETDEEGKVTKRYITALPKDAVVPVGGSTSVQISLPGNLPYSARFSSSDEEIAAVSEDGVIRGMAEGIATISVEVTVDGTRKNLSFGLVVEREKKE